MIFHYFATIANVTGEAISQFCASPSSFLGREALAPLGQRDVPAHVHFTPRGNPPRPLRCSTSERFPRAGKVYATFPEPRQHVATRANVLRALAWAARAPPGRLLLDGTFSWYVF